MKKHLSYALMGSLILLLMGFSSLAHSKNPLLKGFVHPRLVETGELSLLLSDPSIRIVDMRTSLLDYLKGHLPNAVYLNFENLRVPQNGIPAQAPDRNALERLLGESLGLSNDMHVILYSEKSNPNATYLAWALDLLDHKKVGVLNGGWEKWVFEKRSTPQEYPSLQPKKFFGKFIRDTLAEKKWIRDRLSNKGVVIVDARLPTLYSGEEGEEIRRGHIPGARNVYWETLLEGEEVRVWKKKEDLGNLFAASGVTKDKDIVVYCRTGREASHVYFTLKYVLGFPRVRLYRGSWVEWSADMKMPIKTGMEP